MHETLFIIINIVANRPQRDLIETAHYFDVSPEYLLDLTPTVVPLIENIFQELDDNGKKDICVICHKWLMREK